MLGSAIVFLLTSRSGRRRVRGTDLGRGEASLELVALEGHGCEGDGSAGLVTRERVAKLEPVVDEDALEGGGALVESTIKFAFEPVVL